MVGLRLDHINWTEDRYPHGTDLKLGSSALEEVCLVGDFEGIVSLGLGLSGNVCPTVSTPAAPPRLVIDFPHP